jgi:hypothetical protein
LDTTKRAQTINAVVIAMTAIFRGIAAPGMFAVRSHACGFCKLWADALRRFPLSGDRVAPLAVDTPAPHKPPIKYGPLCSTCNEELRLVADSIDALGLGPLLVDEYMIGFDPGRALQAFRQVADTRGISVEAYAAEFARDILAPFGDTITTTARAGSAILAE